MLPKVQKDVEKLIPEKFIKEEKEIKEKDLKDYKEVKEGKEKDKEGKDVKDKEKEGKDIKDKDNIKDVKEKDQKEFKEKEIKEFKEKDFKEKDLKDFKEIDKYLENVPPGVPVEGGGLVAQLAQRVANIEALLATGKAFIQSKERPAVGKKAAKKRGQ